MDIRKKYREEMGGKVVNGFDKCMAFIKLPRLNKFEYHPVPEQL
jgi:hypothetical protein